jgi:hypothetical protein
MWQSIPGRQRERDGEGGDVGEAPASRRRTGTQPPLVATMPLGRPNLCRRCFLPTGLAEAAWGLD